MTDVAPIRLLGESQGYRAFFIEDLRRIDPFLRTFSNNDYIYVQLGWHVWKDAWPGLAKKVYGYGLEPSRFIILANTLYECESAAAAGFSSLFCNHNAWLDPNIFRCTTIYPLRYTT